MNDLLNKIVMVFGGTRGIGFELALGLVRHGATVIVTSRSKASVRKATQELRSEGNASTLHCACDVTQRHDIKAIVRSVLKVHKRIDVMIFASGIDHKAPAEKVTKAVWDKVMRTNLDGAFLVNSIVGNIMIKQKKGSIINITSLGSHRAFTKSLPYCVSKAGLLMLTKSLAVEWAPFGVRVNSITPATFQTSLNQQALSDKKRYHNIIHATPLKRLGKLPELISAAVYLASDQSSYTTGSDVCVDGGFLAFAGY